MRRSQSTFYALCNLLLSTFVVALFVGSARGSDTKPLQFELRFDPKARAEPFTGRVYVLLSSRELKELPTGINWFNPEPSFALDVKNWRASEPITLNANSLAFPKPLSQLKPGKYSVVAVMDLNAGASSFSSAPGNIYAEGTMRELDPAKSGTISLLLDKTVPPRVLKSTDRVRFVELESKLLSAFDGKKTVMRAGVVLPKEYASDPKALYPIIYEIPGFGGNHSGAFAASARSATEIEGMPVIHVTLDPACRWGHHVFADSANNGPRGQALIEEFIPYIEKQFRAIGAPGARFVTGHSSGGWSSLWLQVTYPDVFGGVWSTAPDPVDFRDFQRINIYAPDANAFTDDTGQRRPLARGREKPLLFVQPFSDMEDVMGHGGQLMSFEAVFGPRGEDERPRKLWNRKTGAIDPVTAKAWEKYDIRLVLERNWSVLAPKLAGKIHVYMGEEDTFYLEGATRLLRQSLEKLGSDAVVELFPGKNHGNLLDSNLRKRIAKEMTISARRIPRGSS